MQSSGVARAVPDWAGGTRIGDADQDLQLSTGAGGCWAGALSCSSSRTDGTGVSRSCWAARAARLQRSCHRLIWLNPLLGSETYAPLTRGMQAALPFVDDHLPVHNLASLQDLAERLNRLPQHRPARRQQPPRPEVDVEPATSLVPGKPANRADTPPDGPQPTLPPSPLGTPLTAQHPIVVLRRETLSQLPERIKRRGPGNDAIEAAPQLLGAPLAAVEPWELPEALRLGRRREPIVYEDWADFALVGVDKNPRSVLCLF